MTRQRVRTASGTSNQQPASSRGITTERRRGTRWIAGGSSLSSGPPTQRIFLPRLSRSASWPSPVCWLIHIILVSHLLSSPSQAYSEEYRGRGVLSATLDFILPRIFRYTRLSCTQYTEPVLISSGLLYSLFFSLRGPKETCFLSFFLMLFSCCSYSWDPVYVNTESATPRPPRDLLNPRFVWLRVIMKDLLAKLGSSEDDYGIPVRLSILLYSRGRSLAPKNRLF